MCRKLVSLRKTAASPHLTATHESAIPLLADDHCTHALRQPRLHITNLDGSVSCTHVPIAIAARTLV